MYIRARARACSAKAYQTLTRARELLYIYIIWHVERIPAAAHSRVEGTPAAEGLTNVRRLMKHDIASTSRRRTLPSDDRLRNNFSRSYRRGARATIFPHAGRGRRNEIFVRRRRRRRFRRIVIHTSYVPRTAHAAATGPATRRYYNIIIMLYSHKCVRFIIYAAHARTSRVATAA